MTFRSIIFSSLFLLIPFMIQAQTPKVTLTTGEKERTPLGEGTIGVVAKDKGGYYVLRARLGGGGFSTSSNAKLSIDYYDKKMNLKEAFKIPDITMEVGRRAKMSYEFITQDESDNLYLYYSEGQNKTNTLYRLTLNKKNNTFGSKTKISSQKYPRAKSDRRGSYGLFESADGSKKAIVSLAQGDDNETTMAFVHVFDKELNSLWKRTTKLPYRIRRNVAKLKEINVFNQTQAEDLKHTIAVSNNGDINMLLRVKRRGNFRHDYHLASISQNVRKVSKSVLKLKKGDNEITDALMSYTPEGSVLCTALYGNQKSDRIEGISIQEFAADNLSVISYSVKDFSKEDKRDILISADAETNGQDRRINKRLDNDKRTRVWDRNLLDIVRHDNGTFTLVTEEFQENEITQPQLGLSSRARNGNIPTTQIEYEFGDIVCLNFNKDGQINWIKNFEKNQRGSRINLMSADVHVKDEHVVMIYNSGDRKNQYKQKLKYATVSSSGEFGHGVISEIKRKSPLERYFLASKTMQSTSENELIGFAFRGNRSKVLNFKLE